MSFIENNRLLFENSSDSIIVLQDGLLKYINSNGYKIIGYEPEEIIDHHFQEFVYNEDLPLVLSRYQKRLNNEPIPEVYPFRLVTRNNEKVWFEIHSIEILWDNRPAHLTFFNNINKRKLAEEALTKRESQIRAVLDAVPDMLFLLKRNGTISEYRSAKPDHLKNDFTGKNLSEIVMPGIYEKCLEKIEKAFNSDEVVVFDFPADNNGETLYFEARIAAFSEDDVLAVLRDITKRKLKEDNLKKEVLRLKSKIKGNNPLENIVGKSSSMMKVFDDILKASAGSAHVIIYGESGTGKELAARAVHDLSERTSKSFVPVNCSAVPENLLESEFFGYQKGAFTGAFSDKPGLLELADSGTLFMDEIGEIGLNLQVKLLRAIEGGGFNRVGGDKLIKPDVRIIGAANKNLSELVEKNLLREDFFYRINIIQINLPPLRNRKEDIPLLVYHFMNKYSKKNTSMDISSKDMNRLVNYHWPGNIRELENVILRYITMGKIEVSGINKEQSEYKIKDTGDEITDLKTVMKNYEKDYITNILEKHRWKKGEASNHLGIHRKTLFRKLKEHDIE